MSDISDELWRRARYLVEAAGQHYTSGSNSRYHYSDAVIKIDWSHSQPDAPVLHGALTVMCTATGTVLVTVSGCNVTCQVEDYEAEEFVEYLRGLMVLDDLVRGVIRD